MAAAAAQAQAQAGVPAPAGVREVALVPALGLEPLAPVPVRAPAAEQERVAEKAEPQLAATSVRMARDRSLAAHTTSCPTSPTWRRAPEPAPSRSTGRRGWRHDRIV